MGAARRSPLDAGGTEAGVAVVGKPVLPVNNVGETLQTMLNHYITHC